MNRFTVVWRERALLQLAAIWNGTVDQAGIARASEEIDQVLSQSADTAGQDYSGDRVLPLHPLWALYCIQKEVGVVEVLQVGRPGDDLPHDDVE